MSEKKCPMGHLAGHPMCRVLLLLVFVGCGLCLGGCRCCLGACRCCLGEGGQCDFRLGKVLLLGQLGQYLAGLVVILNVQANQ